MADAKKGDSFMRQNRIKKFLTAGLSGLLILSLTGCGQAAKLPETVVNTSLVVEKDGKVTSYLVNTFDKDFYNLDGLTQMVEEEAEEFNATHTEATENPMNVKTVQVLGDGVMVQVVQEFADTDSYAEYNEQDLFYGTRVEALAQGLTVNRELVNAADGTPADSEKLDKSPSVTRSHPVISLSVPESLNRWSWSSSVSPAPIWSGSSTGEASAVTGCCLLASRKTR